MAVIWGLWQISRMPVLAAPVLMVFLLPQADHTAALPAPAERRDPPRLSPALAPVAPPSQPLPVPPLQDIPLVPAAAVAPAAVPSPAQAPAAQVAPATLSTPAAPPAPPAPPAAAPRRQVSASAVRYLSLPPVELPRASRRASEHGTVWLRVVVDTQGLPAQVSVQRSSGFARLDEQALWAMRQARFKPYTADGQAVEVEVIAPVEYPAD
jgi:protein TonB